MPTPDPWLKADEVAALLRTDNAMVHHLWRTGQFRAEDVFNLSTTDKPNLRFNPASLCRPADPAPVIPETAELELRRIRKLAENVQHELDTLMQVVTRRQMERSG